MNLKSKLLSVIAYLILMSIPVYQAIDIWFNGIKNYSHGSQSWVFQKALDFGADIFGVEQAYRGVSLVLILSTLLIALALYAASKRYNPN